jgi:hypothetical protein
MCVCVCARVCVFVSRLDFPYLNVSILFFLCLSKVLALANVDQATGPFLPFARYCLLPSLDADRLIERVRRRESVSLPALLSRSTPLCQVGGRRVADGFCRKVKPPPAVVQTCFAGLPCINTHSVSVCISLIYIIHTHIDISAPCLQPSLLLTLSIVRMWCLQLFPRRERWHRNISDRMRLLRSKGKCLL